MATLMSSTQLKFQSTLSVRRATASVIHLSNCCLISIHALRKESDSHRLSGAFTRPISIHALRKESDDEVRKQLLRTNHFNPRSP